MALTRRSGLCIKAVQVLKFVAERKRTNSMELAEALETGRIQALRWLYSLQEAFPGDVEAKKVNMDSHKNPVHVVYFSFTKTWRRKHGWIR